MAYDYTIKGNPLASGFQAGSAIGGGLRSAFKDTPAMQRAMEAIKAGADPTQVIQSLSAENPQAAQILMQQMQQQYETQAAPIAIQGQQLRNQAVQSGLDRQQQVDELGAQLAGDNPMLRLIVKDPQTGGLIAKYSTEIEQQERIDAGIPLLGASRLTDPTAKRNLIRESADKFDSFSPTLADGIRSIADLPDDKLDSGILPIVSILGESGFLPKDPRGNEERTAQIKNLEYYNWLKENGQKDKAERFAQAANLNPEERKDRAIEETQGKEEAKAGVTRTSAAVESGLGAIKTLPSVVAAMDLLDKVSTGGYASMKKGITDFLGTTPANEAEFAYLTGKAVLSQLKDTFGAQFTNEEAKRLESLEAGLGRSTEANRAILERAKQVAISTAKRGYRAAVQQGDQFTASEIARQLQALGESVDGAQPQSQPTQRTPEEIESQYINGGR